MGPTSSIIRSLEEKGKEKHRHREDTQGNGRTKTETGMMHRRATQAQDPWLAAPRIRRRWLRIAPRSFQREPVQPAPWFQTFLVMDGEASRERLFPRVRIVSVPSWFTFTAIPNLIITDIGYCLRKAYHFISTQPPRASSSLPQLLLTHDLGKLHIKDQKGLPELWQENGTNTFIKGEGKSPFINQSELILQCHPGKEGEQRWTALQRPRGWGTPERPAQGPGVLPCGQQTGNQAQGARFICARDDEI